MSQAVPHEIGIVQYPAAQLASILGLTDLFGVASTIALEQRPSGRGSLRVTHWKPIHSGAAHLSCVYDSAPGGSQNPRILIIPPTTVNLLDPEVPAGVVSWVRNRYAAGATLVSLSSGAFILAETGLVDGLSIAAHRMCADALTKRFPRIVIDPNRRIIDHGDIITAGGFLAWVDLGLFLVGRIFGPAMRTETARFVLPDTEADEARYSGFTPPQTHRDRAVLKAQEWVHMRDGRDVSLAAMATAAGMERRTLLRRFATATGMSPIEYCRAVRIARARALLESGDTSQKQIADSLGYKDVASFARGFRKAVGSAPGAYRKRFAAAAFHGPILRPKTAHTRLRQPFIRVEL